MRGVGCADRFSDTQQEKKVGRPSPSRIHFGFCDGDVAVLKGRADTFSDPKQEKKVSRPPPLRIHSVSCEGEVA